MPRLGKGEAGDSCRKRERDGAKPTRFAPARRRAGSVPAGSSPVGRLPQEGERSQKRRESKGIPSFFLVHQTNKIRTRSSLWETGSDFVFSTGISISPMVYCAVQNPSREGRERRKLIDTDISQTQTGVSQII